MVFHVSAVDLTSNSVMILTYQVGFCPSVENTLLSARNNTLLIINRLKAVPECGDGLWYRVAYLNMSDSTQECPSNWMEISKPVRTCGQPTSTGASCPGEYFSTRSLVYNKVCGKAIGYQNGSADVFATSIENITDPYLMELV